MCGIAGVVQMFQEGGDPEEDLTRALQALRHRGPDANGRLSWVSPTGVQVRLGMTRLAVVDLSPASQQPMTTEDGRLSIVYNGEITNFIEIRARLTQRGINFKSTGDTEVLLRAWQVWGSDVRSHLEGMYAFAVLDRSTATLKLCRDAFGVKPLFVADIGNGSIAFSSEIASVLSFMRSRPRLNWSTAIRYLASAVTDDSPETFIEGVSHLPPGRLLTIDLKSGDRQTGDLGWWPAIQTDSSMTFGQAAEGVRHFLTESVQRNLRSDVPVGVALSGGIDSTGIAYLVKKVEPDFPIQTFSFLAGDPRVDESSWVALASKGLNGRGATVTPTPGDLICDLDDVIRSQGEPFVSTSIYAQYRVFQLMHEKGVVVSLDGQGADEVFAGYLAYPGERVRSLIETGRPLQGLRFLVNWTRWPNRSLTKAVSRTSFELLPRSMANSAYSKIVNSRPAWVDPDALNAKGLSWSTGRLPAENDGLLGVRVKAELRASLLKRGLQSLLRHGDRNSMRWSIESRVPYLDRELVKFVLSMPERYLIDSAGTSKAVLRQSLKDLIPEEIRVRRDKIGFEAPDAAWLEYSRPELANLILEGQNIGFLKPDDVAAAVSAGRLPSAFSWRVVNLYRWATLFDVNCE